MDNRWCKEATVDRSCLSGKVITAQPINVVVGLVVAEYEEDDGTGVLKRGLIANHFSNVRRLLSFKKLRLRSNIGPRSVLWNLLEFKAMSS